MRPYLRHAVEGLCPSAERPAATRAGAQKRGSHMINFKVSLFAGASILSLAVAASPAFAQNANNDSSETVIVTGTRVQGMTAADSAAPVRIRAAEAVRVNMLCRFIEVLLSGVRRGR
jgi:hypothetical protein